MKMRLLEWLRCSACSSTDLAVTVTEEIGGEAKEGRICCRCGRTVRVTNYMPRFEDDDGYLDNFGFEWIRHRQRELDSAKATRESEERFASTVDFPLVDLCDKVALDVGGGTGRFAEVVLKLGGTVVGVDLSYAVDAALANMGRHPQMHILQSDVFQLPLQAGQFDLIYSLGVLHHTPDRRGALAGLVQLLKPGGKIAIALYPAYNRAYVLATKFWRTFTTRLPHRVLYPSLTWRSPFTTCTGSRASTT